MRPAAPVRILVAAAALAALLIALVVQENAARAGGVEVRLALAGYDLARCCRDTTCGSI